MGVVCPTLLLSLVLSVSSKKNIIEEQGKVGNFDSTDLQWTSNIP